MRVEEYKDNMGTEGKRKTKELKYSIMEKDWGNMITMDDEQVEGMIEEQELSSQLRTYKGSKKMKGAPSQNTVCGNY